MDYYVVKVFVLLLFFSAENNPIFKEISENDISIEIDNPLATSGKEKIIYRKAPTKLVKIINNQ